MLNLLGLPQVILDPAQFSFTLILFTLNSLVVNLVLLVDSLVSVPLNLQFNNFRSWLLAFFFFLLQKSLKSSYVLPLLCVSHPLLVQVRSEITHAVMVRIDRLEVGRLSWDLYWLVRMRHQIWWLLLEITLNSCKHLFVISRWVTDLRFRTNESIPFLCQICWRLRFFLLLLCRWSAWPYEILRIEIFCFNTFLMLF